MGCADGCQCAIILTCIVSASYRWCEMTKEVRARIEELLENFGGTKALPAGEQALRKLEERELPISLPAGRDDNPGAGEVQAPRPAGRLGDPGFVIPFTPVHDPRREKRRRGQRRAWKKMMDDAGYDLPFPEDREAIFEILAYTLGRVVGQRMLPQRAEAIVHLCKLMLRT